MGRRTLLLAATACAALLGWYGQASAARTTDGIRIAAADGTTLVATLTLPAGDPPATGFPAIVMFHGLGGSRAGTTAIGKSVFVPAGFAVLAFDARGHGQSGGQIDVDGPATRPDAKAVFDWLAGQPAIDPHRIGAWGASLGGGAVWEALADGVPFAAAEVFASWVDLGAALAPQGAPKSGLIAGFLATLPAARLDPSLVAVRDDALAGRNAAGLAAWGAARTVVGALPRISTPVALFQGRRDFAFDLAQATTAYRALAGPKELYVGDFGHPPSTFPGPDDASMSARAVAWFRHWLGSADVPTGPPVELAPDPWSPGRLTAYPALPPTRTLLLPAAGRPATIGAKGAVVRSLGPARTLLETFGAPVVRVTATLHAWRRLVAVLTAKAPGGGDVVVADGAVPTEGVDGTRALAIRLISQATTIPRGSRLTLTLAADSTSQGVLNLLYLPQPARGGATATVAAVSVVLPVLAKPVSG